MKKNIIIIISLVIVAAVIIGAMLLIPKDNQPDKPDANTTTPTGPSTDSNTETKPVDPDPTTPPTEPEDPFKEIKEKLDTNELIHGISSRQFISTVGREFNFTIKYKPNGKVVNLEDMITCEQFNEQFPFLEEWFVPEEQQPIDPNKTALKMLFESNNPEQESRWLIGVVNNTNTPTDNLNQLNVIFASFIGNNDWEFCGLSLDMNKEQVLGVLGEPTQSSTSSGVCYMEYYVLKNENVYVLMVQMDEAQTYIREITLNINNHPVFSNT